jgi:hypothetical protein
LAPALALAAGLAVLSTPFPFGSWSDREDYPAMPPQTALSAPVPAPPQPSSSVPLAPLVASGSIGPPAETRPAGQGTAVAVTPGMIVQAQRDLTRLGHDPGGADGIVGPKTKMAIQAFQRRQRLTPAGILTADLADTLQTAR